MLQRLQNCCNVIFLYSWNGRPSKKVSCRVKSSFSCQPWRLVILPFLLQKYQLDRLNFHDSKRGSYEQTISCAEHFVLLGQVIYFVLPVCNSTKCLGKFLLFIFENSELIW